MSDAKVLHRVIRRLAGWAVWSFFTEVHIIGGENVPKDGPLIVTATHHNMMLDPAVLSISFPYGRMMNYWSKATLFINPTISWLLYSSGNIPVDRKSKDRQQLFKGTFQALVQGLPVALFPEGTSYTEPRIMQVKDGAAWAALEYTKFVKKTGKGDPNVMIVPVAIVYTNKSKYRSNVIVEYGQPITMDAYLEQFNSTEDGAPRAAAKRLTRAVEGALMEATINAPDWDTLYAARMARDLMWESDKGIKLDDYVIISQTLVDLFCTYDATPNFASVKRRLLEYYSLLQATQLTNSVLSSLPLPKTLDPNDTTITLPSRLRTLSILIVQSLSSLARLPFFMIPMIVHMPIYVLGRLGAKLVEDEEETQAQNKVVIGLLLLFMIYPATFFFLWAFLWYTPTGAVLSGGLVYLFAIYHNKMINDNYEHAKRLIATWRVLFGLWAPRKWEMSVDKLGMYNTPQIPKANPWVDRRPTTPDPTKPPTPKGSFSPVAPAPPEIPGITQDEPPVKTRPNRRPPSRRIMRHVLRARVEAARALAGFIDQLERAPAAKMVRASAHLARAYGGSIDEEPSKSLLTAGAEEVEVVEGMPTGWRSASEVVRFLRSRGAKTVSLKKGGMEGEWAAR